MFTAIHSADKFSNEQQISGLLHLLPDREVVETNGALGAFIWNRSDSRLEDSTYTVEALQIFSYQHPPD